MLTVSVGDKMKIMTKANLKNVFFRPLRFYFLQNVNLNMLVLPFE